MSTTEIRCLETSTHLLGTILHLDDVIGTFAGRQVAAISNSTAITLLAVVTRVAVTAALIFLEFGIISLYSPLIASALVVGMYFYPVPELPLIPIRPPEPPVGAPPAPLIPASPPNIIYPPIEVPAPTPTGTTSAVPPSPGPAPIPTATTPLTPSAPPKRPATLPRGVVDLFNSSASSNAPLSSSTIETSFPRLVPEDPNTSHSTILPAKTSVPPLEILASEDSDSNTEYHDISESEPNTPMKSPRITSTPRATAPGASSSATNNQIERYENEAAKNHLIVIFTQALGDDLGPFFVNKMLPPNIVTSEYNPRDKTFAFTLSSPKEGALTQVGPKAISGVQGSRLRIQDTVRGTLSPDLRGITFTSGTMQMIAQKLYLWHTATLTGLRSEYSGTITLSGTLYGMSNNIAGTAEEFRDTFSNISWNT